MIYYSRLTDLTILSNTCEASPCSIALISPRGQRWSPYSVGPANAMLPLEKGQLRSRWSRNHDAGELCGVFYHLFKARVLQHTRRAGRVGSLYCSYRNHSGNSDSNSSRRLTTERVVTRGLKTSPSPAVKADKFGYMSGARPLSLRTHARCFHPITLSTAPVYS